MRLSRKSHTLGGDVTSLVDITDLSSDDLARLAGSPLVDTFAKTDNEPNRVQFGTCGSCT
ncbi:MAG: hypothetical protein J2P17_03825 [Mycobacterium sp.]|nr:hypothetical protein [Mycobacterium sp.]